jgi:DNA-binding MarR family transcriptional regulator
MTTATDTFARFGYVLALTERTLSEVLRRHLAERDVVPETWYTLQVLAIRGPVLARTALSAELAGSRGLDPESTRELLARVEAEGLIEGGDTVELTGQGRKLHRSLSEYVAIPRVRLLSAFDPDDVATTIRTLQAITERAAEEAEA